MTKLELIKQFMLLSPEKINIQEDEDNLGNYLVCTGEPCPDCILFKECDEIDKHNRPTMSKQELDNLIEKHPELCI